MAVPMGRQVLLSMPDPDDEASELPIGIAVTTLRGRTLQRFPDCPGLHGEAVEDDYAVFGCDDGVLVLEGHGDHFHAAAVTEPDGTAEDVRVGTVRAAEGVPFMVGNFGPDALVRIDPAAQELTPLPLPADVRSFHLHPFGGGTIVVLTTDGHLHLVDGASGDVVASKQVVSAFGTTGTRPALDIGQHGAYVADPRDGRVTEVALPDLRITARIPVGGQPSSIAVVHR